MADRARRRNELAEDMDSAVSFEESSEILEGLIRGTEEVVRFSLVIASPSRLSLDPVYFCEEKYQDLVLAAITGRRARPHRPHYVRIKTATDLTPSLLDSKADGTPLLRTRRGFPSYFSPLDERLEAPHWLVVGATGSGKSFFTGLILKRLLAEKISVLFIDHNRSFKRICRALEEAFGAPLSIPKRGDLYAAATDSSSGSSFAPTPNIPSLLTQTLRTGVWGVAASFVELVFLLASFLLESGRDPPPRRRRDPGRDLHLLLRGGGLYRARKFAQRPQAFRVLFDGIEVKSSKRGKWLSAESLRLTTGNHVWQVKSFSIDRLTLERFKASLFEWRKKKGNLEDDLREENDFDKRAELMEQIADLDQRIDMMENQMLREMKELSVPATLEVVVE